MSDRRQPNRVRNTPAATADPITPATFGPIAGISGVIDLLLRDPESGELLVVDYKTDQVDDEQALAERAAHYHPQLATYAEALKQALDLDNAPPTELWFVTSDRVWRSS